MQRKLQCRKDCAAFLLKMPLRLPTNHQPSPLMCDDMRLTNPNGWESSGNRFWCRVNIQELESNLSMVVYHLPIFSPMGSRQRLYYTLTVREQPMRCKEMRWAKGWKKQTCQIWVGGAAGTMLKCCCSSFEPNWQHGDQPKAKLQHQFVGGHPLHDSSWLLAG